jgi:hypothetical protein
VNISKTLLKFKVGLRPKEEVLSALIKWKSTPKFFKVFIIFTKVINLVLKLNKGINAKLG